MVQKVQVKVTILGIIVLEEIRDIPESLDQCISDLRKRFGLWARIDVIIFPEGYDALEESKNMYVVIWQRFAESRRWHIYPDLFPFKERAERHVKSLDDGTRINLRVRSIEID